MTEKVISFRPPNSPDPLATKAMPPLYAPASIGAVLERRRSELLECCTELGFTLPSAALSYIESSKQVLNRLTCRIAIIGQVKAGKSSFINALVKRPGLLPTHVNPWTTAVTHLHFGTPDTGADVAARFTFFDQNEWARLVQGDGHIRALTQRLVPGFETELLRQHVEAMRLRSEGRLGERLATLLGTAHEFKSLEAGILNHYVCAGADDLLASPVDGAGIYSDIVKQADLYFESRDFTFPTVIVDTPGTNDPFLVRDEITRRSLEAADLYVVVLTAKQALSSADVALLRMLRGLNKERIAVFINRIDELGDVAEDAGEIIAHVRAGLGREFPGVEIPIVAGSAIWALAATSRDDLEVRRALSAKALHYAARTNSEATVVTESPAGALMMCSGLPAFARVLADLAQRSHAGYVLHQIEASLKELAHINERTALQEIRTLQAEGRDDSVRLAESTEELRQIHAEFGETERLAQTLHGLLVDLQGRTERLIAESCTLMQHTLRDTVLRFADVECQRLESAIAKGDRRRVWMCETAGVRRALEADFVGLYRAAEHGVANVEAHIFPKLREVLSTRVPDLERHPTEPVVVHPGDHPPIRPLGQTVALDLAEPWWRRWWASGRSAEEKILELDRLIRDEFYPIVDMLVEAARVQLQSQQKTAVKNATVVYLSLIDILEQQSHARLNRSKTLRTERDAIQTGAVEQARRGRVEELERQIATARRVTLRIDTNGRANGSMST